MKELSLEQKAQRYDRALERAREWYNDPHITIGLKGNLEDIFPELRESEDERIRKELISFLQLPHPQFVGERKQERWLAWLEKQAPVEHFELKRGHWYMCHRAYCCRADYLTVQEGERFEYKEDGVVKGFVIKDPEKYFIEVHAPAPMEDDQNDEVRRRSTIQVLEYAKSLDAYNQYGKADIDKNIAWLEKQSKVEQAMREVEEKAEAFTQAHKGETSDEILAQMRGEQNPANKVEPKFKVGDWIVNNDSGVIQHIKEIVNVNDETLYVFDEDKILDVNFQEQYHLWTIQDARDGDVLSDGTTIFIFKDLLSDGSVMSYCDCDTDSGESDAFCPLSVNLMCSKITPATKEQRDTLEKAITNAGYRWDKENLKLEKGEQEFVVDFKAKDWYVSKVDGKIYNAKFMEKTPINQARKLEIEKAAMSATGIIEQEEWFIKGAEWSDKNPSYISSDKSVKIKGFVAVDNCGDKTIINPTGRRVAFFPKKPVRDLLTNNHYWAAHISPYDVIHLSYEDFPELKWEDEPIEVEITINKE